LDRSRRGGATGTISPKTAWGTDIERLAALEARYPTRTRTLPYSLVDSDLSSRGEFLEDEYAAVSGK
jgi:hypothetical protein